MPGEMVLWDNTPNPPSVCWLSKQNCFPCPNILPLTYCSIVWPVDKLGLGHTNAIHGISHLTLRTIIRGGHYYHPSLIRRERSNEWVSNMSKVIKLINYGFNPESRTHDPGNDSQESGLSNWVHALRQGRLEQEHYQ